MDKTYCSIIGLGDIQEENLEEDFINDKIDLERNVNIRECAEHNNVALPREGTAEVCCQELGNMDQWQILANGPAGPETAELNNVTLQRDKIAELSCQEGAQSLANWSCGRVWQMGQTTKRSAKILSKKITDWMRVAKLSTRIHHHSPTHSNHTRP